MNHLEGKFYKLDGISKEDEELIKDYIFGKGEDAFLEASHIKNDWPSGRGIFINNAKTFWIKVNNIDHLEITYETQETGFMEAINKLNDALTQIEDSTRFAHDYKLGYVTSLPKNINEFLIQIKIKIHETMEPI